MGRSISKFAVSSGLAFVMSMFAVPASRADVGPIEPARQICMGKSAGEPCEIDGKSGTCQGPHVSRMYCTPGPAPSPAADPAKPQPAPAAQDPAQPTPPPANPETPPRHKGSCAAAEPGSALLSLAVVSLFAVGRRRRRARAR